MNPATALATVLVDELVRCGVRDAVVAPGSRSAPLALALYADGRIRLHVRIDERSAAFLALGLARRSGLPVAVVCTSGTAAANLHPAVLEADRSEVGLLVLTADRPPDLRDTGANQVTDQIKLFGPAVRLFAEVGVPQARAGAVRYWRSLACRAVAAAVDGPVHLNLAFHEPLLPDGDPDWPDPLHGRPDGAPWTVVERPTPAPVTVRTPARGIVVAGDGTADPVAAVAFAAAAGWPLLAEPTSNARHGPNAVPAYPLLLPVVRDRLRPEAIVTFGRPSLSRELLAGYDAAVEHTVVHPGRGWFDPTRTAARLVRGPVRAEPLDRAGPGGWLAAWQEAGAAAAAALDGVLDHGFTELRAARDLAAALPAGTMLYVGPSLPIRHLDLAMAPRYGLHLLTNRGLSGIDGAVSTLLGAALGGPGRAVGLLGDLTLLHDQNGLLLGPAEPRPDATIVVLNNDGGGLFAHLAYRGLAGFERLFATPPGAVLEAVATATGWPYRRVRGPAELTAALDRPGLVEVVADRAETVAEYAKARAAVAAALASV